MSPNFDSGPMTPPARPATVADVLDAAADHIQQHGWAQGSYRTPDGCCCARGAIAVTRGDYDGCVNADDVDAEKALEELGDYLVEHDLVDVSEDDRGQGVCPIITWNDEPGRTADEVIGTLRRVAAEQRTAQNGGA